MLMTGWPDVWGFESTDIAGDLLRGCHDAAPWRWESAWTDLIRLRLGDWIRRLARQHDLACLRFGAVIWGPGWDREQHRHRLVVCVSWMAGTSGPEIPDFSLQLP